MTAENTRRLILIRHGKSEWSDVDDHERPLAAKGRKDAPAAGKWLAATGITPGTALCSTALRCRETWKLAAAELPQRPPTRFEDRLYDASLGELTALLNETSDEVTDLVVVSHNPGLHALADALAGDGEDGPLAQMRRGGFPSASVAVLTFDGPWKSLENGSGHLTHFWSPTA
ncbi:histidine phosphatase family protein [Streptomyces sp. NRRL S-495]|uniref:SixA phosphatase family protein n=1 Tax=Streptomyces sp. NRRL S-495 TaxID=1609133 RepID=UPI0005F93A06|nr:histidine phosphatase family protein [Streptomyces sp. NRRL S-495]KJY27632.1 phosphohistidine phosphatase [Streptomyces sp. NRRL S-495]